MLRTRQGVVGPQDANDALPVRRGDRDDGAGAGQPVVAPGILPIAFPLFHYTNIHDAAFMGITGQLPIWNEEWQARVQMAIDTHGKDEPVEKMIDQRIGDYEAFGDYQRAVFGRTEAHVDTMDPADLDRVIVAPPYLPQIQNTYSERCAGPRGITVLDATTDPAEIPALEPTTENP